MEEHDINLEKFACLEVNQDSFLNGGKHKVSK